MQNAVKRPSINQSISQSMEEIQVNQSINQLIEQIPLNQSINRSNEYQSINQSIHQSINRTIEKQFNQSINRSMTVSSKKLRFYIGNQNFFHTCFLSKLGTTLSTPNNFSAKATVSLHVMSGNAAGSTPNASATSSTTDSTRPPSVS